MGRNWLKGWKKLIQCMASGVRVVASPVGVNREIFAEGQNGMLVETEEDWLRALRQLLTQDAGVRQAMGAVGRANVEARYSRQAQAPFFISAVREAAG